MRGWLDVVKAAIDLSALVGIKLDQKVANFKDNHNYGETGTAMVDDEADNEFESRFSTQFENCVVGPRVTLI